MVKRSNQIKSRSNAWKSVKDLISDASEGAQQIIDNKYEEEIINEGYLHVKGYGISFYKKYCYIVKVQA